MSTAFVGEWQDFSDIVRNLSGLYKEQYVRIGAREFGITEKTAKKRLNDAINDKDSRIFEINDPQDRRRKIIYREGSTKSNYQFSATAIHAQCVVADEILQNGRKWSYWDDRLRAYWQSLQLVRNGLAQLEEAAASGRTKYAKERHKLQTIYSDILRTIKNDPAHGRMQPLISKGVIPSHPLAGAERLLRTAHFAMDKLPSPHKLARRTGLRGKKRRLQKSQELELFYGQNHVQK